MTDWDITLCHRSVIVFRLDFSQFLLFEFCGFLVFRTCTSKHFKKQQHMLFGLQKPAGVHTWNHRNTNLNKYKRTPEATNHRIGRGRIFAWFVLVAPRPVFCVFCFNQRPKETQDGQFSTALVEAFAWQFIYFGESDVNPRVIQTRRIEGPGRG